MSDDSTCLNCNATLVVAVILTDKRGDYALCRRCFSSPTAVLSTVKPRTKTNASATAQPQPRRDDQLFKL